MAQKGRHSGNNDLSMMDEIARFVVGPDLIRTLFIFLGPTSPHYRNLPGAVSVPRIVVV